MSCIEGNKGANSELVYPVGPKTAQLLLLRFSLLTKSAEIIGKDRIVGILVSVM